MNIDKLWLREGQILGLQMLIENRPQMVYWRVLGRELADYRYNFASTATNVSTGFIDLVTGQNVYILEPRQRAIINHFFVGIMPSDSIMYLQYPANVNHNALVGNRAVDAEGTGGVWGFQSPYSHPSARAELFTIADLRPLLAMFNANGNTQTPRIKLHAMQYMTDGPFVASDLGGEDHIRSMIETGNTRMYTIYGAQPYTAPDWVIQSVGNKLKMAAPAGASRLRGI